MTQTLDLQKILSGQRTARGLAYERHIAAMRDLRSGSTAADREKAKRMDDSALRVKAVGPSQVHSNQFLANISVQYQNDEYIGERLMPVLPVDKRSGLYATYPKSDRHQFPNDVIAPRGRAAELGESRSSGTYVVADHALQDFVSVETLQNQDAPFDEMLDLTESIAEGMAFNREKRIAAILTTGSNFAGNTTALSGATTWDSSGNPVTDIQTGLAAMYQGRGGSKKIMYSSLAVYNVLANHSAMRDLFKYTGNGLAMPKQIAGFFGCDDYLIGASRENTANETATAVYARIWSNVFGIVRVADRPTLRSAVFGYTPRLKSDPVTTQWFDAAVGKAGGYYAKNGVSECHTVVAGDTGFLYTGVCA